MKKNIQIAIPTMGTLRVELAGWLLDNELSFICSNEITPHSAARNTLVDLFMTHSDADYLMMVDADTVPPEHAIDDLLAVDADVVTGVTPITRGGEIMTNVFRDETPLKSTEEYETPFEVRGCGASCLLIKREVFEKLEKPYFKAIEFDNGNRCSEDLYFCDAVRGHGMHIVCQPSVVCKHFKTVSL